MSYARGFGLNGKSIYANIANLKVCYANFIVDHSNGNGLGIRSLKSNGYIESVFMNTSSTPGVIGGFTNPNPVAGYALVRFKNTFNYYLGGFSGQITPLTSTSTTSLTAGHVYVVTSLGTTTLAQWLAAGILPGTMPTTANNQITNGSQTVSVGQSFISLITGSIGGTGTVGLPGEQVAPTISVVGDPNQSISNTNIAANAGAQIMLQFSGPTSSSVTTLVATAPADGTVVGLRFDFDGSTVTIDGL